MSEVDPDRFNRFEAFLFQHVHAFVKAAREGYADHGPGVLVFRPPDDRFDGPATGTAPQFEYKSSTEIEAAQARVRDVLIQGLLERYQPPREALIAAVYPDRSYDVSRVVIESAPASDGAPS
jgi:hypothetical protein